MKPLAASLPAGARRGLSGAVASKPLPALVLALVLGTVQQAHAQDRTQTFDIPAQDASSALLRLCLVADCELAFARGPGGDVLTRPVRGRMAWKRALEQMLDGTGLRYRFVGARGVRIWAPARASTPPARETPPEAVELEPVIVTGRLSSQIDGSLQRKRDADVISDGVSSERIGDLPAANLAEALQRAPGVAIEREVGEGQFVSVRGLGPLFQSVTLNGAPVAFNENIRNSTQSGRQFRFRALSADLLAGARLIKSPTPDLVDGGIGSNIDIETAGGLDGDPFLSLRVGGESEARTGRFSPDVGLIGRLVSTGGDFGVIVGLSQEDRLVRYDRFQIMRYEETLIDGERLVTPNDVRTTVEQEDRRRRSALMGVDWRVSQALRLDADILVSTFGNSIREDRLVYALGPRLSQPGAVLRVEDGVVTAARIADGRIDSNTEFSDQDHLNVVASLGAEIRLGDWRLTPRLSASRARSVLDTPLERFSAQSPEGVAYAFDLAGAVSSRRIERLAADFDLMDPSHLAEAQLNVRAVESRDDDVTALFDARRPLTVAWGGLRLSALQLGGQVSDRSRDYERRDRRAALRSSTTDIAGLYGHATPDDVFGQLILVRSAPWAVVDFERMRAAFLIPGEADDVVFRPRDLAPTGSDSQNSYRVGERVAAAYVRLDFDGVAAGYPLFGNLGLRWVATRTWVEGARMERVGDAAEIRAVTFDGEHDVLLPSLNLAFDLNETTVLRLAASRSITRPSLADLRASTVPASVLVSDVYDRGQAAFTDPTPGVIFSGVGGNPDLAPYVSTNLDLSYEVTRRRTSFSVAVFRKIIDDFVQAVEAPELLTFETRYGSPVQAEIPMARPRNVGRATIDGLEIGLNRRLPAGLGLWANATWTDSRLDDGGRLTGVSDLAWSVSPYWERGPIALHLSWSWRSAFRSEADMQGGGVSNFMVAAAGYLDGQLTYDLSEGVQLSIAASNLTDTRDMAYEGTTARLLQLGSVGREASVALRFRW